MSNSPTKVLVIALLFFIIETSAAQIPFESSCKTYPFDKISNAKNQQDGYCKPNRTDTINGLPLSGDAYFPVLIVFVQFLDDPGYDVWPNDNGISGPIYKDSLIAFNKSNNPVWWKAYDQNKETFSDYYLQLSRGRFHVLGKAYSVRLDYTAQYYRAFSDSAISVMNTHIWKKLINNYKIDWSFYDKWSWDSEHDRFIYEPDNYIDFIYKIHKSTGSVLPGVDGFNCLLGRDFKVDSLRWIRTSSDQISSGITCARNIKKDMIRSVCIHEHGHYTFAFGHLIYGHNMYGLGGDEFYSPYEMILSNYMTPRTARLGYTNYLKDYSSRYNGDGEIIKVPISETEFFLLANRTKICHWDRLMLGDTAFYSPFNTSDYGKGLYIYHVFNGIKRPDSNYSSPQDLECADGYFRWERDDWAAVDMNCWTSAQIWRTYKKAEVLYENDPSKLGTNSLKGDQLSLHDLFGYNFDGSPLGYTIKHGFGAPPDDNCHSGTDKLYTNRKELFSSYSSDGDRWDAWRPGYNELFSPYSSPSTAKYDNDTSGVFIWFKGYSDNGAAQIDIYKTDENNSLESILLITPPSRPMGLTLDTCFSFNGDSYIKLSWLHNREPDMERGSKTKYKYKRYKIYRSYSTNENTVPPDSYLYPEKYYTNIATVDVNSNTTPSFIDTVQSTKIYSVCCYLPDVSCPPICYNLVNVRYRIQAVDINDDASRLSDFEQCRGYKRDAAANGIFTDPRKTGKPQSDIHGNVLPDEYNLKQNFPNPFNPTTNIGYDVPRDGFVTLKIYDITGRQIKTLVSEFINAGRYIIGFDGKSLSSGIYYYILTAGNYTQIRRMVLIK